MWYKYLRWWRIGTPSHSRISSPWTVDHGCWIGCKRSMNNNAKSKSRSYRWASNPMNPAPFILSLFSHYVLYMCSIYTLHLYIFVSCLHQLKPMQFESPNINVLYTYTKMKNTPLTLSQKTCHPTFVHNFGVRWPIFQNAFTLGCNQKFGIRTLCVLHLTLHMLLHYLAKLKMPLLPISHYSCYKNIYRNSFIFS